MPVPKPVSESLYIQSGRILEKVNGTEFEYLVAINARTGVVVADNLGSTPFKKKTGFNDKEMEIISKCNAGVILLHNHPSSKIPSYRDLMTTSENKQIKVSVVVGHDGSAWHVSIDDTEIANKLNSIYYLYKDKYGNYAEVKAVRELLEENDKRNMFVWERVM